MRRHLLAGLFLATAPVALAACGGGDDDDVGGIVTAPPLETSTVAGSSPPAGPGSAEVVRLEISADQLEFNKDELTAKAGSTVEVKFTNEETVPHNIAFYRSKEATDKIFVGDIISGPDKTVTYAFAVPSAGEYFFRCDVHPTTMIGDFNVTR